MTTVLRVLFSLLILAAGLVFAASMALAVLVLGAIWGLRVLWGRLTGQPVAPFVMRVDPRGGFQRMYRASQGVRRPQQPGPAGPGRNAVEDITDVEPKERG